MTIGAKIRYCRNRCGISQAKLAELSGTDLSSINRYETNKTIPLPQQIKKLADALGIGALAFSDTYFDSLREVETYGDLIRVLIIFRKNNLVQIVGERDENGRIRTETAEFKLNPIIGGLFSAADDTLVNQTFRLNDNKTLEGLLQWESAYSKYEQLLDKYGNDESAQAALNENDEILGKIELELQYDNRMLKRTNGHITVKVNPDYGDATELAKKREKAIKKELKSQAKKKRKKSTDNQE